jgi:PAS domain S-box-containing protein
MLSELAVPVVVDGESVAVLDVESYRLDDFTTDDQQLLETLASHVASAVSRLKRENELKRYYEHLEELVEERTRRLRENELELRSARDQLEHVLATNPAVLFYEKPLPDLSDTIPTFVSESARFVLGFEPKEFLGESGLSFWRSRIHPDDLARFWSELPSLWRDGHHTFEYRFLHSNGTYRWIAEQYKVIRDAEGHISNTVTVAIDITDRKKLEEKLAKAERLAAIGETAAMVGHDLRNPLQGIAAATYLLKDETLTKYERNEMLQVIEHNVEYSDGIVNDLLDYARPIELTRRETTPKEIVASALQAVHIPGRVKVENQSQEHLRISVDQARMKRVFVNLIENAVDAMPSGGTITISTKESIGFLEIAFADTGSGLPEKILENLWKPLQTTKAKGMGLGLAIVKRVVDAHGGQISVKSKTGEGTTYTIHLPLQSGVIKPEQR